MSEPIPGQTFVDVFERLDALIDKLVEYKKKEKDANFDDDLSEIEAMAKNLEGIDKNLTDLSDYVSDEKRCGEEDIKGLYNLYKKNLSGEDKLLLKLNDVPMEDVREFLCGKILDMYKGIDNIAHAIDATIKAAKEARIADDKNMLIIVKDLIKLRDEMGWIEALFKGRLFDKFFAESKLQKIEAKYEPYEIEKMPAHNEAKDEPDELEKVPAYIEAINNAKGGTAEQQKPEEEKSKVMP
jgi:hypothetical protein